jgi:hypothetical protein
MVRRGWDRGKAHEIGFRPAIYYIATNGRKGGEKNLLRRRSKIMTRNAQKNKTTKTKEKRIGVRLRVW